MLLRPATALAHVLSRYVKDHGKADLNGGDRPITGTRLRLAEDQPAIGPVAVPVGR
jgi:hypothetical protein